MDTGAIRNGARSPDDIDDQLRVLALVDRVIGLEAEVARLSASGNGSGGSRAEIERLRAELNAVYASTTWRVGSLILRPLRALRGASSRSTSS